MDLLTPLHDRILGKMAGLSLGDEFYLAAGMLLATLYLCHRDSVHGRAAEIGCPGDSRSGSVVVKG